MNNLRLLRERYELSQRDMYKYTTICNSIINYLECEHRPFRQKHIEQLTAFFDVSADFLLAKSDTGINAYDEEGNLVVLTEDEYHRLKPRIKEDIVTVNQPFSMQFDDVTITCPHYSIYREIVGSVEELNTKDQIKDKLSMLVSKMDSKELARTIKFIEEYIIVK